MQKKPNIFFIIIDAMRYDVFPFYGYRRMTTPFLKELARTGVFFENAFSTATWTLPAHVSYLTGLSTYQHGVDYNMHRSVPYPNSFVFLPALLKEAGYITSLTSEQLFLTPKLHDADDPDKCVFPGFLPQCGCGFDYLDSIYDYVTKSAMRVRQGDVTISEPLKGVGGKKTREDLNTRNWEKFVKLVGAVDREREVWPSLEGIYRESTYFTQRYDMLREIFQEQKKNEQDNPIFAMINLHTGQMNFEPELRKRWFQEYFRRNLQVEVAREELDFFDVFDVDWMGDNYHWDVWELLYAYDLNFMDCSIRLLYEFFTREGFLTEEDYFLWVTDHGLGKGETKLSFRNCHHGAFPFEWLIHSPLFARGPAFDSYKGRIVQEQVSTLDIYPTIAKAAQVEVPEVYQKFLKGKPLQQRLDGVDFEKNILVECMVYVSEDGVCLMPRGTTMKENWYGHEIGYCLINQEKRLVCISTKRIVQLFDIRKDPLWEHPVEKPGLVAPVIKQLQNILEKQQPLNLIAPGVQIAEGWTDPLAMPTMSTWDSGEMDEKVVASLKALGYY